MKLTLKTVERKEVATPNGREPTAIKVGIQANELGGNKWASCFETEYTKQWKAGDVVEVADVVQKGKYLNIVLPRPVKGSTAPVAAAGRPVMPAGNEQKEKTAAQMLAALAAIASHCELIVRILQRIETKTDISPRAEDFRPGDELRRPSGGCTERTEQPPPADEEQHDGADLPF